MKTEIREDTDVVNNDLIGTDVVSDDSDSVNGYNENVSDSESETGENDVDTHDGQINKYSLISARRFQVILQDHDSEFLQFCQDNSITPPNLSSLKGQVIALLTHKNNRNKYVTREILDKFLGYINKSSKDSIQLVNKTDQWGLKHVSIKHEGMQYYQIPYPFEYIGLHVEKRKKLFISGSKEEKVNLIKEWISVNYIDVPYTDWQIGHKDPNKNDNSEANLVYQPPIQGRFRDRFKFDDTGLVRYPTIKELSNNPDLYYNKDELRELRDLLVGLEL